MRGGGLCSCCQNSTHKNRLPEQLRRWQFSRPHSPCFFGLSFHESLPCIRCDSFCALLRLWDLIFPQNGLFVCSCSCQFLIVQTMLMSLQTHRSIQKEPNFLSRKSSETHPRIHIKNLNFEGQMNVGILPPGYKKRIVLFFVSILNTNSIQIRVKHKTKSKYRWSESSKGIKSTKFVDC